jgi:hypothetical protein
LNVVIAKGWGRGTRWSCGFRERLEGEVCGIPHLAKNERDVGHPAIGAGIEPKTETYADPAIVAGIEPQSAHVA